MAGSPGRSTQIPFQTKCPFHVEKNHNPFPLGCSLGRMVWVLNWGMEQKGNILAWLWRSLLLKFSLLEIWSVSSIREPDSAPGQCLGLCWMLNKCLQRLWETASDRAHNKLIIIKCTGILINYWTLQLISSYGVVKEQFLFYPCCDGNI